VFFQWLKNILALLGSILLLPIGIGIVVGGGYTLFSILNGNSIEETFARLKELNSFIQPYFKYVMPLFLAPFLLKAARRYNKRSVS